MPKIYNSCSEAVEEVVLSGSRVMIGGFGTCGSPESLLAALSRHPEARQLTVISGTGGSPDSGLGRLIASMPSRVKCLLTTYIGANADAYRRHRRGQLELELLPQGSFAERIRAGGAGVAAFYTRTGVGTSAVDGGVPVRYAPDGSVLEVSQPKEVRQFDGEEHVLETALKADVALVKAWRADPAGNLQFRLSASNFNGAMCQAARTAVAEVEELVECGQLQPEHIHVPAVFVQGLVLCEPAIARPGLTPAQEARQAKRQSLQRLLRQPEIRTIASRVAAEIRPNSFANLGLGIPTLAAEFLPRMSLGAFLHSENGVLGLAGYPTREADCDPDLINASRDCVTLRPGGSCFDSVTSFAIVSGGHLDLTVLGATQVSEFGDLANWIMPGVAAVGMGGAMELVSNGCRVVVAMRHCTREGRPKIVTNCSLPVTGRRCVDAIITELGLFQVDPNSGLTLTELAEGVPLARVAALTGCKFSVSPNLRPMLGSPAA